MNHANNSKKDKKTLDKVIMGAVIGGAIGSVIGATISPRGGKETREEIKNEIKEAKGSFFKLFNKVKALFAKKKDLQETVKKIPLERQEKQPLPNVAEERDGEKKAMQ